MKVLIVFEEVPETVNLCMVDNPTEEELGVIRGAAGQYINNSDDTEDVEKISEWMGDGGKWNSGVVKDAGSADTLFEGPFDLVCICGFIM